MLGLSLFSLLSHTCTFHGNALLRQWLLSPLQSVEKIRERHDTIAFFLEPAVQDTVQNIRKALKKAGDVQVGLKGIRRGGIHSVIASSLLGAKRTVGKKGSSVSEWRSLIQVLVPAWTLIVTVFN
jgi:hypothetical protein